MTNTKLLLQYCLAHQAAIYERKFKEAKSEKLGQLYVDSLYHLMDISKSLENAEFVIAKSTPIAQVSADTFVILCSGVAVIIAKARSEQVAEVGDFTHSVTVASKKDERYKFLPFQAFLIPDEKGNGSIKIAQILPTDLDIPSLDFSAQSQDNDSHPILADFKFGVALAIAYIK
jgi:hypothetical protein